MNYTNHFINYNKHLIDCIKHLNYKSDIPSHMLKFVCINWWLRSSWGRLPFAFWSLMVRWTWVPWFWWFLCLWFFWPCPWFLCIPFWCISSWWGCRPVIKYFSQLYALESVSGLVLQEVLVGVVDQAEPGGASASEVGLEAEKHDVCVIRLTSGVSFVFLRDDVPEFFLWHVGQIGVDDVQDLS